MNQVSTVPINVCAVITLNLQENRVYRNRQISLFLPAQEAFIFSFFHIVTVWDTGNISSAPHLLHTGVPVQNNNECQSIYPHTAPQWPRLLFWCKMTWLVMSRTWGLSTFLSLLLNRGEIHTAGKVLGFPSMSSDCYLQPCSTVPLSSHVLFLTHLSTTTSIAFPHFPSSLTLSECRPEVICAAS